MEDDGRESGKDRFLSEAPLSDFVSAYNLRSILHMPGSDRMYEHILPAIISMHKCAKCVVICSKFSIHACAYFLPKNSTSWVRVPLEQLFSFSMEKRYSCNC